jgi:hypothetical protein
MAAGDSHRSEAGRTCCLHIADFEDGDFVWFTYTKSKDYGEAFVSETALRRIIGELGLPVEVTTEVTTFDSSSFVQDVFILRRLES